MKILEKNRVAVIRDRPLKLRLVRSVLKRLIKKTKVTYPLVRFYRSRFEPRQKYA